MVLGAGDIIGFCLIGAIMAFAVFAIWLSGRLTRGSALDFSAQHPEVVVVEVLCCRDGRVIRNISLWADPDMPWSAVLDRFKDVQPVATGSKEPDRDDII